LIRVNKPTTVPERLRVQGKNKRRAHSQAFTRNPTGYQAGTEKFKFDDTIYNHPTVKTSLLAAQHQKCCFCERIGEDGDVEHFRPKQAYRQQAKQALQYPGYYWLAYEWNNLYFSCSACNQRHKQNLFPLANPAERAADHTQSIAQEQPLFIDPGKDNPEDFIGFRGEIPFAINGNAKGSKTIESLKLSGRELPRARLAQLQRLKALHQVTLEAAADPKNTALQQLAQKAQKLLEDAIADTAEFAAAARCAVQTNFQFVIDPI
jgi:uncharacterized protein (TIGR02646 family)